MMTGTTALPATEAAKINADPLSFIQAKFKQRGSRRSASSVAEAAIRSTDSSRSVARLDPVANDPRTDIWPDRNPPSLLRTEPRH